MAEQRLLFVCLGNICRSPAAEGVFLHLIAQAGLEDRFVVDSAGTGGWHVGHPADRRMRAAAERRGIHLPSRARQIELADFSSFDRILTMDDDNLQAVRALAAELHEVGTLAVLVARRPFGIEGQRARSGGESLRIRLELGEGRDDVRHPVSWLKGRPLRKRWLEIDLREGTLIQ